MSNTPPLDGRGETPATRLWEPVIVAVYAVLWVVVTVRAVEASSSWSARSAVAFLLFDGACIALLWRRARRDAGMRGLLLAGVFVSLPLLAIANRVVRGVSLADLPVPLAFLLLAVAACRPLISGFGGGLGGPITRRRPRVVR